MRNQVRRSFKASFGCYATRSRFLFIIFFTGAIFFAAGPATAQNQPEPVQRAVFKQRLREAVAVQNRHTAQLIRIPDVVGVGTGLDEDGRPEIRVFGRQAGIAGIPRHLDGIPVKLKVTGMFLAYSDPTDRLDRPVPIGVSTGHPAITAGTIGARVKDEDGYVYALSNNHVYADQNNAQIGDSALQPGAYDGGVDPADKIGELFDFEPIDFALSGANIMDAAIAAATIFELGKSTLPQGYGIPNSAIFGDRDENGFFDDRDDLMQLAVQKFGRTSGLTHGIITEINVTARVCYANCSRPINKKTAVFADQIGITGNNGAAFSAGGDSGSLIVTDDPRKKPVALLFAGGDTYTLANRIDLVLNRFDVTIDGASPQEICAADFDRDRDVDASDLYAFIGYYPQDMRADLNDDGIVNASDLNVFSNDFGRTGCP